MKIRILAIIFCFTFFSCEKESIVDTQSEDLNAVLSTTNTNNFVVHPLHLPSSGGTARRTNRVGNPVDVPCTNLEGYVSVGANGRVNYDRVVQVRYVIKDSEFPFREEVLSEESYIVEANKSISDTKPILRLFFAVQGELTSSVVRVTRRSNGAVISCNTSSQTFDFVNCFSNRGGFDDRPELDDNPPDDDDDNPGYLGF